VPASTPVTTPEVLLIVAIETSPLTHVPPAVIVLKLVVVLLQTVAVPVIAEGTGSTVTAVVV
jgi:hypothetical protein